MIAPREFHTQQLTALDKAATCFRRHASARQRQTLGAVAMALLLMTLLGFVYIFISAIVQEEKAHLGRFRHVMGGDEPGLALPSAHAGDADAARKEAAAKEVRFGGHNAGEARTVDPDGNTHMILTAEEAAFTAKVSASIAEGKRKSALAAKAAPLGGSGRVSFPARPAAAFLSPGAIISQHEDQQRRPAAAKMRKVAKAAMVHSWDGYKQFAWGSDELAPPYRRGKRGAAPGATIVDSLSTLKIMGLESRFQDAIAWVKAFNFRKWGKVSFFETTIRDLGGLLAAYDLTGDPELLAKATQVLRIAI